MLGLGVFSFEVEGVCSGETSKTLFSSSRDSSNVVGNGIFFLRIELSICPVPNFSAKLSPFLSGYKKSLILVSEAKGSIVDAASAAFRSI